MTSVPEDESLELYSDKGSVCLRLMLDGSLWLGVSQCTDPEHDDWNTVQLSDRTAKTLLIDEGKQFLQRSIMLRETGESCSLEK